MKMVKKGGSSMENLLSFRYVKLFDRMELLDGMIFYGCLPSFDEVSQVFFSNVRNVESFCDDYDSKDIGVHIGYFITNVIEDAGFFLEGLTIAFFPLYESVKYEFDFCDKSSVVCNNSLYRYVQSRSYLGLDERVEMDEVINGLLFYNKPLVYGKVKQPSVDRRKWV